MDVLILLARHRADLGLTSLKNAAVSTAGYLSLGPPPIQRSCISSASRSRAS
jgi:hypothetical protein